MFERILVPTDGSDGAQTVIERAVDIASRYGATIDALYVADARIEGVVPEEARDAVLNAMRREGEEATNAISAAGAERDVRINTVVREGIPHQTILQHVKENDVDLIVMGTHGRTGLERQIIGSVAERIVRLAQVPVMTVPLGEPEEESTPDRSFQ
ncbi:MAG: universal stress protein [Halodesulfurarchaeum sp.]